MSEKLTGQAALAAKLAVVIHEFCEDLPWKDSERIGIEAAQAAWHCGTTVTCPNLTHIAEWLDHKVDQLEPHTEESAAVQGSYDAYTVVRGMVGLAIHYPERWMERHERLLARKAAADD